MNSLEAIHIDHACELAPADTFKNVSWILTLEAKLNPYSLEPSESASIAIHHSWRAILTSLVLRDLREGAFGARVHAWKSKRCVIVYNLSPDTDYLRSLGFFNEDGTISAGKEVSWKETCLQYAFNATWIFCPEISSEPDVKLPSHIRQIIDSCHGPVRLVQPPRPSVLSPDFMSGHTAASPLWRSGSYLSFGSNSPTGHSWAGECSPTSSFSICSFLDPLTPSTLGDLPIPIQNPYSPIPGCAESSIMTPETRVSKQLYNSPRRPGSVPTLVSALVPSAVIRAEEDADHPIHTYGPRLVINSPMIGSHLCSFRRLDDDLDVIPPIHQALGVYKKVQFHVEPESRTKRMNKTIPVVLAQVTKKIAASMTAKVPKRFF